MYAWHIIHWIRSKPVLAALIVAIGFTLLLVVGSSSSSGPAPKTLFSATNGSTPVSVVRTSATVRTFLPQPVTKSNMFRADPGVHIRVQFPGETNPPVLGIYAPAGRLIRAVTVNALHSANIDTPLIALVTDDVWHDGEKVIPAGSELHGRAAVGRSRDRIVASGPWIIVLQSGEELTVTGIALDRMDGVIRANVVDGDGVAGLKGRVIKTDSAAEIKLFASTFLSGAAGAFQQQRNTLLGTEIAGNARNAALGGASAVLNSYAQQISEAIRRDGAFVLVPAGHPMYLYVTHTLDRSQARIGNLRVTAVMPPELLKQPREP